MFCTSQLKWLTFLSATYIIEYEKIKPQIIRKCPLFVREINILEKIHYIFSSNAVPYQLLFGGNAVVQFDRSEHMSSRDNTRKVTLSHIGSGLVYKGF